MDQKDNEALSYLPVHISSYSSYVFFCLHLSGVKSGERLTAHESSSSSFLRKTISEPQTGIEAATFWWPVRRSNHWATKTQMVS